MAMIKVCDRCGVQINPPNSATFLTVEQVRLWQRKATFELCVSCAMQLHNWMKAKEEQDGH